MSELLKQSLSRTSNEHLEDRIALEIWSQAIRFIRTGEYNYTLECPNAKNFPRIEKKTQDRISAWCKLVALRIEWSHISSQIFYTKTTSQKARGAQGTRNFMNEWRLNFYKTNPPSAELTQKLISEYGRPPGY